MIFINRQQQKTIEYHFVNHANDLIAIDELTAEIAERYNFTSDITGIRSTAADNDKTIKQIEEIEKTTKELRKWVMVVKATKEYFAETIHSDFIKLYYEQEKKAIEVAQRLYVAVDTVYKYRQDVLNYAALIADKHGLIKL